VKTDEKVPEGTNLQDTGCRILMRCHLLTVQAVNAGGFADNCFDINCFEMLCCVLLY